VTKSTTIVFEIKSLQFTRISAPLKHQVSLDEAEVFSLSITNPDVRPLLPFDWFIHPGLILACTKLPKNSGDGTQGREQSVGFSVFQSKQYVLN